MPGPRALLRLAAATLAACLGPTTLSGCGRLGFDSASALSGTDGGVFDAGHDGDGGRADDAGEGRFLSQDFEAEVEDWQTVWTGPDSALARTTTTVHSGTSAMSVTSNARGGGGMFERVFSPGLLSGQVFMRAFFYIPANQSVSNWIVLMEVKNKASDEKISFDLYETNFGFAITNAGSFPSSAPIFDRWFCAELAIDIDSTNGAVQLFLDDQLQSVRASVNTVLGDGADFYRVGMITSQQQKDFSVFVDDFVVSNTRIGCNH